jgi:putative FmdB family regulatory protein
MPLFDLECQACQHRWEDMVKTGETPPPCPTCGATQTQKRVTFGAAIMPIIIPQKMTFPRGPKRD